MTAISKKGKGGRPPKFQEVRRPITVTLPERILTLLETVNSDRARAIVKCVEAVAGNRDPEARATELIEVLPGKALIVVGPNRSLKKIGWLRLVEITATRYLLLLPPGMPIERLEVEIQDLIETLTPDDECDRAMLNELRTLISQKRQRKAVSKGELIFVDVAKKG